MSRYPVRPEGARTFGQRLRPTTAVFTLLLLIGAGMALADTPGTDLVVTPNANLTPAGQNVSVSGTDFAASESGSLRQCIQRNQSTEECSDNIGTFTTDASGAFAPVTVNVRQSFTAGGQPATCSSATPCSVFAQMNAGAQNAHEPITFFDINDTSIPGDTTTTTIAPTTTSSTTTTSTSTTTTTIPPTTTTSSTSTTVRPTTTTTRILPTSTTILVDICARLRAQRAVVNAQISAIQASLPANLRPQQRAALIAQLEASRARANAQVASALALARCP